MPNNDPQDILIVQNIDLNCNDIDSEEGWSHADFFQVKWGGQPHRIAPGETRRMPRYVAEHFAKHLADHMLQRMEKETGRQFLMNHAVERPNTLKKIIVSVDEYFLQQDQQSASEGVRVAEEVDRMNPEEKALDLGEVPNPMVGNLQKEPEMPEIPDEETDSKETSIFDPNKSEPTINELRHACKEQGIDFTLNDKKTDLIAKLKSF